MYGLIVVGGAIVNAVVIAFLARRLLGVPVGWPRTLLLSLAVNFAISPLIGWIADVMHLAPITGHRVSGVAEFFVVGLVICWVLVAEVMVLALLEALAPTGTIPNPLRGIKTLPAGARRGARYTAILRIAAKHGLSAYVSRRRPGRGAPESAVARSLREAFTEAGGTFVKLGQMLSTRPDLLPAPYIEELSRLQTDVPPEPWEAIEPVLTQQLGRPVEEVFERIDRQVLAAASVAQIYAARLRDGTEVVVKVQRPRARAQVTADLDIVMRLARMLHKRAPWARTLGVVSLAGGFAESLEDELDYRVELANMQAIGAAADGVRVPRAYPEFSGAQVLVMERLPGRPLTKAAAAVAALPPPQRLAMAQGLFTAVLRQMIVTGVFHADLHAGNIFVDCDCDGDGAGTLALLDFGSVGRLDQGDRTALATLLMAVDQHDAVAATAALTDLLDAPDDLDRRRVEREVGQLIMRYAGGLSPGGSAKLFAELFAIVLRHGLAVPAPVAAAFRALGALEGSLSLLAGEMDLVATAKAHGRALLHERLGPAQVRSALELQLAALVPVLQRLPRRIDRITSELESGSMTVGVRLFADRADREFVTGVVQQVIVAVLTAALAIGGILLVTADNGPWMTDSLRLYTFLGAVLLLFASVLGSRALALVFRRDRRQRERE